MPKSDVWLDSLNQVFKINFNLRYKLHPRIRKVFAFRGTHQKRTNGEKNEQMNEWTNKGLSQYDLGVDDNY